MRNVWHRGYLSLSAAPLPTQSGPQQQSMGAICSTNPEDDPSDEKLSKAEHPSVIPRFLHNFTKMIAETPAATKLDHIYNFDEEPWSSISNQVPTLEEKEANRKLQIARKIDIVEIFEKEKPQIGFQNQKQPRKPDDHFLSNVDIINGPSGSYRPQATTNEVLQDRSRVLQIVERMPKGAHLHVHFNANLDPNFLLAHAEKQPLMTIISNKALADEASFDSCEIQFSLLPPNEEPHHSLFDTMHYPYTDDEQQILKDDDPLRENNRERIKNSRRMSFKIFHEQWNIIRACFDNTWTIFTKSISLIEMEKERKFFRTTEQWLQLRSIMKLPLREWLVSKLVFHAEEVHHHNQDQDGAWAKFNGRTRMMKGLFNYETVYRAYTRQCLQQFVNENIQYAEIRPNFMRTNSLLKVSADGKSLETLTNKDTLGIIIEEFTRFKEELDIERRNDPTKPYFGGLKVIYCAPRSFSRKQIEEALDECYKFKKDEKFKKYIAGFDLVGEESKGFPLSYFREELDAFQDRCDKSGVNIPFLLHCGETEDDPDNNLETALQLKNTPRIGHGFALLSKPQLRQGFLEKKICIESCPISNEILGLSSHPSKHAIYGLLNSGYQCTLNSDNPTLFRSTLSHDFYQFLVGRGKNKQAMTLHVCKQLIEWSIEHSRMDDNERRVIHTEWKKKWDAFITWVNELRDIPDSDKCEEVSNRFHTPQETIEEKGKAKMLQKAKDTDDKMQQEQKKAKSGEQNKAKV